MAFSPISRRALFVFSVSLTMMFATPIVSFAATTTSATNSTAGSGSVVTFTPLTSLPGIKEAANATTLPVFLNTIYKICIGAGSVLAVIMIMVAGVEFMTSGGSFATNQKAKARLQNALFGLLLVLSPTIVFGIINPKILNLDFTADLANLRLNNVAPTDTSSSGSSNSQQQLQCNALTQKKTIDFKSGDDVAQKCSALGAGWAHNDDACCAVTDNTHACCGYSAANIGTPTPPTPEEQSGKYGFDFYLREQDYSDEDNGFCFANNSYHFTTQQACTTALSQQRSTAKDLNAYSDNCSGTLGQITPRSTYDSISKLHSCQ